MPAPGKYCYITEKLLNYLAASSTLGRDPVVCALRKATLELGEEAILQLNLEAGGLLMVLAGVTGARRILELGTFTGLSALCLARGMAEGGQVVTCDKDKRWLPLAQRHWKKAGVAEKIQPRIGLAGDLLRKCKMAKEPPWDLIFVDADKGNYPIYYEESVKLLKPGGVLVMDNALRGGRVMKPKDDGDEAVAKVNRRISRDPRVRNVLLPLGDGVQVCWKVGHDLTGALSKTELPEDEAAIWHRDLQTARKTLKAPADKWR